VHVFEPLAKLGEIEPPYDMPALAAAARERLDGEWITPLLMAGVPYDTVFTEGDPDDRLAHVADDIDADLLVVGDRGHTGLRKMLFGSTALELPRKTTRPVTVIHSGDD
jgi:nucleotide-binding universal stress UspA family protein